LPVANVKLVDPFAVVMFDTEIVDIIRYSPSLQILLLILYLRQLL
jgi:hypothetical protein